MPNIVFQTCDSCKRTWFMDVGQKVCDRCLLHQEREARQADKEYLQELGQHLEEWKDDFHAERERAEQYKDILCRIVAAQNQIDIEAMKPLHQRSKNPIAKKQEAIKEARRVLGGE